MKKNNSFNFFNLHPTQILVLGFAAVILIGSMLLNLPIASQDGQSIGFVNALFTSTSAVCVTGLVVVDTLTHWTIFGQIVILFLIQIGGLGFMTMGTLFALILGKKITLKKRLIIQEALNQFNVSGVVRLTKYVLIMTFTIEGIGAALLSIRFIPTYGLVKGIWYSIFHAISAFCNAGFDLIGNFRSLTPFVNDPLISLVVLVLIVLGGIGFVVILDVLQKKSFAKLSLHSKLAITVTVILIGIGFISMLVLEFNNPHTMGELPLKGKLLSGMFHSITPRTAGFNILPTDKLTMASIFFTIVLMFIGGSSAGTAGGVKITTVGVIVITIVSVIKGKTDTEVFGRRIPRSLVDRSLAIIGLATGLVIFVTMILLITEAEQTFIEVFFEAVSAFGTVGLSLGITPSLSTIGKLIIALTMFFGRVGPLTIFLALAQQKKAIRGVIRYPEEKVIVG